MVVLWLYWVNIVAKNYDRIYLMNDVRFKGYWYGQVILSFALAFLVVFIKTEDLGFVVNSLWAEDGKVFLNQAYSLGVASLFEPYAGYIHLWPRLVALGSTFISLLYAPWVFFLGWFIPCAIVAWAIIEFSRVKDAPLFFGIISAFAILLPPHTDEIYFTLTNAQWIIPIYLSLIIIFGRSLGVLHCLLVFVFSLTGPFAVIFSPFVFLSFLLRWSKAGLWALVSFTLGVLIQLGFIFNSGRSNDISLSLDLDAWLSVILSFFVFGQNAALNTIIGVLYWLLVAYFIVQCLKRAKSGEKIPEIMILLFGIAVFAASLWSLRNNPSSIGPVAGGARYFFIPYALSIVFCLSQYSKNKKTSVLAVLLFVSVSALSFKNYDRSALSFHDYALLHEKLGGFHIPIHPQWAIYPGWGAFVKEWDEEFFNDHRIDLGGYYSPNGFLKSDVFTWQDAHDPNIIFENKFSCPSSSIGSVVFKVDMSNSGWVQLFWNEDSDFNENDTFSLYREEGVSTLVYVVPYQSDLTNLRLDPPPGTSRFNLIDASYLCVER